MTLLSFAKHAGTVVMLLTYWIGSLARTVLDPMVFVPLQIAIAGARTSTDPMIH